MGEISKCSRRAEKPVSGSGNSGKRGSKMAGRSHSKDDKRKCSGIRNMWHYGTIDNETIIGRNTRSDDGFSISNVSFVLAKDNQIVYHFPAYFENNSTENDSVGMFDSVEAVGFQDIDGDGAKDVIVIINYVTGAGPQGMMPRKTIRIFSSQDNGFVIQHDLMDELMENMKEDDISIPAICDYVTLMETNEIYDGYRTIYQQYFADEGCDFMISYGANGNSRVILNENEEIIEYLVYDRLSENEKCELYVLYRSKKNTDGSWYISEAEILDIFAYSMSTKDVVSSGKTSWSATGSEEHEIN